MHLGAFEAMHGPKAVSMLSKFYVGELAPSEIIKPSGNTLILHFTSNACQCMNWVDFYTFSLFLPLQPIRALSEPITVQVTLVDSEYCYHSDSNRV